MEDRGRFTDRKRLSEEERRSTAESIRAKMVDSD
jgi:hypothetical protein